MITIKEIFSKQELEIAFQIREKVFILEQNVSKEEEFDQFDEESTHFLAFFAENPAGTARFRLTEKGFKLERFAVLKEFRNKTVGFKIMENILTKLSSSLHSRRYLYAQLSAVGFYEKFGFEKIGQTFLDAGIEHIEMEKFI